MADDQLKQIVQRMIDAGEPEENIATVIQGYKPPRTMTQEAGDFVREGASTLKNAVTGTVGLLAEMNPMNKLRQAIFEPEKLKEQTEGIRSAIMNPKGTLKAVADDQFGDESMTAGARWGRRAANVGMLVAPFAKGAATRALSGGAKASEVSALPKMGAPFTNEGAMAMKSAPEIVSADARIARSLPDQQKLREAAEAYSQLKPVDQPLKPVEVAGSVPPLGASQPQFPAPPKRLPAMPDRPHQPTGLNRTANDLKYRAEQARLDKAERASRAVSAPPQAPPPTGGPATRPGHFKLPTVKDPEAALAAAEQNATLKARGTMPEPVPEEVHLRSAERRANRGVSPTGTERRVATPRERLAGLEGDTANPAYAKVPFQVADDATMKGLQADYMQPSLEDVNLADLIATQGTITRDVAAGKLGQQVPRLEQLPVGAKGRAPVGEIPVVIRGADGKLYIGDGTHSLSASWAEGAPSRQAVVYPEKAAKAAAGQAPPLGAKNAPAAAMAETKGSSTMSPQEMRDFYGTKKAAGRLGVTEDELRAMTKDSKKFPKEAEAMAEDQAYRNRIADDSPYVYSGIDPTAIFKVAKKYPKLFGAAGGAALGSQVSDDPTGGALLGGGAGLLGGALLKGGPKQAVNNLLDMRVESMLSGTALPKNVAASIGNPITMQLENIGAKVPLQNSPIKEALRLPTNASIWMKAFQNPTMTTAMQNTAKVKGPFGRAIGATDEVFKQVGKRAGATEREVNRLALTEDNQMFSGWGETNTGRFIWPFQRTPANALTEGVREGEMMLPRAMQAKAQAQLPNKVTNKLPLPADEFLPHVNPKMRRALTVGSGVGGFALGDWVKEDPIRRGPLAAIMLASLGPRTLPATAGAMLGGANTRTGIGSLSPIQEWSFDPKTWLGMPPAFFRFMKQLKGERMEDK